VQHCRAARRPCISASRSSSVGSRLCCVRLYGLPTSGGATAALVGVPWVYKGSQGWIRLSAAPAPHMVECGQPSSMWVNRVSVFVFVCAMNITILM
jgi:hypothetical protein